jgi:hypothetical protein
MNTTTHPGISFLLARGWNPVAASGRWAAYRSAVAESGSDSPGAKVALRRFHEALDPVLTAYRQEIWARVDSIIPREAIREGSVHTPRTRKLRELAEEAGRLMGKQPRAAMLA